MSVESSVTQPEQTPLPSTEDQPVDVEVRTESVIEVDTRAYDAYVAGHTGASPYHCSAWLRAVERAYGHRGLIVSAYVQGRICGVLPLSAVKRPMGPGPFTSLPFCDLGGPLADTASVAECLMAQARALAVQQGNTVLESREAGAMLTDGDEKEKREEREKGAQTGALEDFSKVSMICRLPASSEDLFKSYKPKLRSQIRKAEKNGLTGEISRTPDAIDAFYRVFSANMHRLGSPVHSRAWFHQLRETYGDQLVVALVCSQETVVGAGIVLCNGERASIPWASTLAEYNRLAPNMLLYWTLLSHVCDNGCREFDFGRSTPDEGTYRFKKQWGAAPRALIWRRWHADKEVTEPVTRIESPPPSLAARIRPLVEQVWRRLPLGLANWLGPKLRKYITL